MAPATTSQISLRAVADAAGPDGPDVIEQFAQELRDELTALGVQRFGHVTGDSAPGGTRGVDAGSIATIFVTIVQTAEALTKVVHATRALARKYAKRRQRIRVAVEGDDVDLAAAGDEELRRVVTVLLSRPATRPSGTRSALVIANDRYTDPRLAQLRSPGHDAEALVRVLGDPAIGGFEVQLLQNADERTLRRRIATFFADRDRDDLLLLHFSCHGIKDVRGRLHLAAHDTDLSVLGATAVPAGFVSDLLADTQSRRVVLILDCCYSGAFARGTRVRSGSEVYIDDEFGTGSGRIVLTASSATEYAFEGNDLTQSAGQPSVFTKALVDGLESGAADLDTDGEITIDELYEYAYRNVRETTPGQTPMKWSLGVEGNLVVARSVRPATLPAGIEEDLASDRPVLRLEAVRVLSQLMRGARSGIQAAARAKLAEVRDDDDSAQVRQAATAALGSDHSPVHEPGSARAAVPAPTLAPVPPSRTGSDQPAGPPAPPPQLSTASLRIGYAGGAGEATAETETTKTGESYAAAGLSRTDIEGGTATSERDAEVLVEPDALPNEEAETREPSAAAELSRTDIEGGTATSEPDAEVLAELDALPDEQAAAVLATFRVEIGCRYLLRLDTSRIGAVLDKADTEWVLSLLDYVDGETELSLFGKLQTGTQARIIDHLEADRAASLLVQSGSPESVLGNLHPAVAADLLDRMDNDQASKAIGTHWGTIHPEPLRRLAPHLTPSRYAELLALLPPKRLLGLAADTDPAIGDRYLTSKGSVGAAALLNHLPTEQAIYWLDRTDTARTADLISHMEVTCAAAVLTGIDHERAQLILDAMRLGRAKILRQLLASNTNVHTTDQPGEA